MIRPGCRFPVLISQERGLPVRAEKQEALLALARAEAEQQSCRPAAHHSVPSP